MASKVANKSSAEHLLGALRRLIFHLRPHVLLNAYRERRRGMAELGANDLGVDAHLKREGGKGMPQIVQPRPRIEAGLGHDHLRSVTERVRVQTAAVASIAVEVLPGRAGGPSECSPESVCRILSPDVGTAR
jgi:hypothetical protein